MDIYLLTRSIKQKALDIGFDLVGVSPVDSFPENQFYKEWLARGFAGEMDYMERNREKRENVKNILPNANSIISCGLNYNAPYPYSIDENDKRRGWIARYAWGEDYHEIMKEKLTQLEGFVRESAPEEVTSRTYVDTGPVLERVYGKYSGIGWFGKNTCLINQKIGSWIFLGEIITNLELDYDSPVSDRCGTCTMCIDACPTDALREPYILDSNLCISYLTIELKGNVPLELREKMGNNIFGCDICQDVCPWNRRAKESDHPSFLPKEELYYPGLSSLSHLTSDGFRNLFKKSPIKRAKRKGFLRNVMIAVGNSGDSGLIPFVKKALNDEEPIVRAHAAWALWRLQGSDSQDTLSKHIDSEIDPMVREEIVSILNTTA